MTLLLVALGAFFLTEFNKAVLPALHPWVKMLIVVLGAGLMAAVLVDGYEEALGMALGGAGLAALVHKAHRLLSALGDAQQVAVMMKATGRGRRP